jgi:hypothetical protein
MPYYGLVFNRFVVFVSKHSKSYENLKVSTKVSLLGVDSLCILGDFRNISTIFIFLLAVAPYNFFNFDTKWCKNPILCSKTNRGDIRIYFKTYEKNR